MGSVCFDGAFLLPDFFVRRGKYKPKETDVAAVARASPEERREKAEQLRVIPEKKPKADKESARSGTKRQQEVYATIDKSYEDMKDSKRVTEDSALVSLRYTARNMVETCDVLFTNFPGLLEKPDYKDQVIEIMQEPKTIHSQIGRRNRQ